MNNINRSTKQKIQKSSNIELIYGDIINKVNSLTECMKWLSYEPEHEKERRKKLYKKTGEELTIDELEELRKYKNREYMKELLKKYANGKYTLNEYLKVCEYMEHSINDLMLDKLTAEELKLAKAEIVKLSKISKEKLREKITEEQKIEKYESLSMVDSYIFHIISNIDCASNINKLDRKIKQL